ncbi:sigma factor-like helix-turn-helix DNA-binding protein [Streptomyces avicenniae]|uniref:sigma factor-like helix-turn-helix DNA-binding protein n=1 Tax=Streptomyces avicenniae TaxID=500153 RepID=UPI00069AB05F|nr:sigma factor-like helix-turn-helix DNA-binding protein [Streptomyces avicenniae]
MVFRRRSGGPFPQVGPARTRLDYQAFRELRHAAYLRFAQARTGDPHAASSLVDAAFIDLAAIWPDVLRSARPAAIAWSVLGRHLAALDGESQAPAAASFGDPFTGPGPRRSDAMLLHQQLGMSVKEAAEVMGIDETSLRLLLRP